MPFCTVLCWVTHSTWSHRVRIVRSPLFPSWEAAGHQECLGGMALPKVPPCCLLSLSAHRLQDGMTPGEVGCQELEWVWNADEGGVNGIQVVHTILHNITCRLQQSHWEVHVIVVFV